MNRRIFLASAACAASAAGANTRIRTAFWGTRHSHFSGKWKAVAGNTDYEIAGICEPDPAARAKVKDPVKWLTEEELLADATIRLVVVEGPPGSGTPLARKAIAAGKHVHVEKPPTNQLPPFRSLVEEARAKKLCLQTGYIWRFHEGIGRAIEAERQGWLGEVYLIRGTIHTDIAANQRQDLAGFKGGMMFELGCHQLDRVVALLGRPNTVKSWLKKTSLGQKDGLADQTLAVFEYDNALAVISTSARMPGATAHRSFEVIGTEGAVLIQPVEPGTKLRVSMRESKGPYKAGWQDVEIPPQPRYVGDFLDMARAIHTSTPLKYSYDFELMLHETILRASQEI